MFLLISRSMDLCNIQAYLSSLCSINKLSFPSIRCSASSFSSEYLLLFLKASRSCVPLPIPFNFVICRSIESRRRLFILGILPMQLAYFTTLPLWILNKQSWAADQQWSSSLQVLRKANNLTVYLKKCSETLYKT